MSEAPKRTRRRTPASVMSERLRMLAAIARSLGLSGLDLGCADDVVAALAAEPGARVEDRVLDAAAGPSGHMYPPMAWRSAKAEIDGVELRAQTRHRAPTEAELAAVRGLVGS